MQEQRRAPRLSTSLKMVNRNSGNSIDTQAMNMSSRGVFISTGRVLPVDAELVLNLQLPDDPEIMAIDGRVVWTKMASNASPAGMGIEFVRILPHHEKKISTFVEENIVKPNSTAPVTMYI